MHATHSFSFIVLFPSCTELSKIITYSIDTCLCNYLKNSLLGHFFLGHPVAHRLP